jgi:hypothetical protein
MDLELHAARDHMDLIQNVANSWMEDDFQDNDELRITCASLRAKCKVLCSSLDDVLGGDVDDKSGDGSDSEEVCLHACTLFYFCWRQSDIEYTLSFWISVT